MTIGTPNRNDNLGTGALATYSFTFKIFSETDLLVTTRDTDDVENTLTYGAGYSVSAGPWPSGGTITLTAGSLASGYALTIRRVRPLTQTTDLRNQSSFYAEVHEDTFDSLTMVDQQQQDEVDRSLKLPESVSPADYNTTLPVPEASKAIGWDADGTALRNYNTSLVVIETLDSLDATFLQSGTGAVTRSVRSVLREIKRATDFSAVNAGAQISLAIAALPVTGGTVDARGLEGVQSITSTITIDRPVDLILGAMTLSVSAAPAIRITSSNVTISGQGAVSVLSNTANTLNTGAMITADFSAGAQASGIVIENIQIIGGTSLANCYKRGILFRNVTKSAVRNCKISGIDVPYDVSADSIGIYFHTDVTFSSIENNTITFAAQSRASFLGFRTGILLQSLEGANHNGQTTGVAGLPQTTTDIRVSGNTVYPGSYGISLHNVARVVIADNIFRDQVRNIIGAATNSDITITGNVCHTAVSTNMAFDFGNNNMVISGNVTDTITGPGEGNAIELYYNNRNVSITGNTLKNFTVSGVFLGYGAQNISIVGNTMYSEEAVAGGVQIVGAMSANYTETIPDPSIVNITVRANRITLPTSASNGIRIVSKEAGSTLDPVDMTNIFVDDNDITATGAYGVIFLKNGGTGVFTPTMGSSNTMAITSGYSDGPFGSDYNVLRNDRGSAIPTNGSWAVGSIRYNTVPALGGNVGWVCITAGTPGTWIAFGTPVKGQTYTPVWNQPSGTQPVLGNGTLTGLWTRNGSLNTVQIRWVAGSSTTYGNNSVAYQFSLPPVIVGTLVAQHVGVAYITDASATGAGAVTVHKVQAASGEQLVAVFDMLAGVVRQLSPITFTTGDSIEIFLTYDAT